MWKTIFVGDPALRSLGFTRDGEHVEPLAQGGERSRTTEGGELFRYVSLTYDISES